MIQYIAHLKENEAGAAAGSEQAVDSLPDSWKQPVCDHLEKTAELAAAMAADPWKNVVFDMGILHDIGKYQASFQKKIRGENLRVDHSTCGAIEAGKRLGMPAAIYMEYCIAGHHAGLPDGGRKEDQPGEISGGHATLSGRLKQTDFESYDAYRKEVSLRPVDQGRLGNYLLEEARKLQKTDPQRMAELLIDETSYLIRYCYSCLVDADSLDTEHFCKDTERATLRTDFAACLEKLDRQMESFRKNANRTLLQQTRSDIQEQAFQNIAEDADVYLMSMPTGSGKTLCSAKCALMKALGEQKKHIIYVIPYNSIISQTADQFQQIFNGEGGGGTRVANILRHQSTYSVEDDENADDAYKLQVGQAVENWDADFIITTEVQFFETLFSHRRSRLRKMHNMADSVLIFDEAHLIPVDFMQPCLEGIAVLTKKLGCKAIFLTATMPDYRELLDRYSLPGLRVRELVPDKSRFDVFRKCRFQNLGRITEEQLLTQLGSSPSTLVVVNSRKTARSFYEKLGGESRKGLYHLSTYMTKRDIQLTIDGIRQALAAVREDSDPVIVISTSLIEAGVDLDFCTAYRELTGLDSILQTGGRCNREGKRKSGDVYVFELRDGTDTRRADKDPKVMVTRALLKEYPDVSDELCIREYYQRVYLADEDKITGKSMARQMMANGIPVNARNIPIGSIPFASYEPEMIISADESVIVPETEEAQNLVEQIRYCGISRNTMRQLQQYTCSVPRNMLEELYRQGVVENLADRIRPAAPGGKGRGNRILCLANMEYYRREKGILTEGVDDYVD
ncbi:CRISPR-associated helicase Cas3' [Clostridium vitabionis]|uniref:CRISPR-associated helicase Cas3' n=1 Tax=Clostridium vitabionis TaxID=2784388 RepID=UPI00188A7C65|nr:CRISPR-associated helicase Cas3' [Clostridium vitabionis]